MSEASVAARIEARLRAVLVPTVLVVLDESAQHAGHAGARGLGGESHFRIRIASPIFTGKSRLARHRLVYDAVQDFMNHGVHALAIETLE